MPSVSRIFSRNQYAPVIFWEAVTLLAARSFATDDSRFARQPRTCHAIRHSPALPCPAYALGVKIILLCLAAAIGASFAGCASKKSKSRYRNYEGDENPGIRMLEEKPGYPLNTR